MHPGRALHAPAGAAPRRGPGLDRGAPVLHAARRPPDRQDHQRAVARRAPERGWPLPRRVGRRPDRPRGARSRQSVRDPALLPRHRGRARPARRGAPRRCGARGHAGEHVRAALPAGARGAECAAPRGARRRSGRARGRGDGLVPDPAPAGLPGSEPDAVPRQRGADRAATGAGLRARRRGAADRGVARDHLAVQHHGRGHDARRLHRGRDRRAARAAHGGDRAALRARGGAADLGAGPGTSVAHQRARRPGRPPRRQGSRRAGHGGGTWTPRRRRSSWSGARTSTR